MFVWFGFLGSVGPQDSMKISWGHPGAEKDGLELELQNPSPRTQLCVHTDMHTQMYTHTHLHTPPPIEAGPVSIASRVRVYNGSEQKTGLLETISGANPDLLSLSRGRVPDSLMSSE